MREEFVSRIPFSYLEDLFSAKIWEKLDNEGAEALKPAKVGSWCTQWQLEKNDYRRCCAQQNNEKLALRSHSSYIVPNVQSLAIQKI
jgi:hypothetical protein